MILFVLALLFGAARVTATSAARSLEVAATQLSELTDGDVSSDQALADLRSAQLTVDHAEAALRGFDIDVVAALPLIGRSLDAERNVVVAVREALAAAVVAAERLPSIRAAAGGVDLGAVTEMRELLDRRVARAESAYTRLARTSTVLVPGIVRDGVEQARDSLGPAVAGLRQVAQTLELAEGLLGGAGPRSVLIALENNAELRGTGGYVASFATGTLENGQLRLDPLQDVVAVADAPAQARQVAASPEYREDYGPLSGDTTIWRSWNMSPDVPHSAEVGARVAGVLLGEEPDIVVLLDVPAMSRLAALGGSGVTLPDGTTVSPQDLTDALLVDSYAEAGADAQAQAQRRADLQSAATTAVTRLLGGEVEALETVRALGELVQARHLKIWSARAEEQQQLEALGVGGSAGAPPGTDLAHISVNNVAGNKIDIYIDREVEVDVVVGRDTAEVVQRVRFSNRAPEGLVPYVSGVERPGSALSRVEFSIPVAAEQVEATVDGRPWTGTSRQGEDRRRLATRIEVPRGGSSELQVRYTLPVLHGSYRLRLVPQPLAQDAMLDLSVRSADGSELAQPGGDDLEDGALVEQAPFTSTRRIEVVLPQQGLWSRFTEALG